MKTALAASVLFSLSLSLAAQSRKPVTVSAPSPTAGQPAAQPAGPNLNAILGELQRTTQAANVDLSKLRIEKWKADGSEKQQMQQVAESLQKNITMAVPGLINDLQAAPGSVSKAFKLYHNMNVVYEFLNSLAEAAATYGKKEEYEPLANDASALDNARQNLSSYIEQTANNLEIQLQKPVPTPQTQPAQTPKKVVIDDDTPPPKKKKKKAATTPKPTPSPTPPQ
jgi:hypothetical protein